LPHDAAMTGVRMPRVIHFLVRMLRDFFRRNHGMMLSGSVAFNMMLSLIPLCAVLILLLGAQVIADLQRNADLGIPWHEPPPESGDSM